MRRSARSVFGLVVLLLPACSLLLDFDELQGGDEKQSGDGGSSCPEPCNDNQACTADSCDSAASPPRCKFEPIRGLVDDGYNAEIQADSVHRVTMTSAADTFYFTVFETTNGAPELTLYSVQNNSSEHQLRTRFSGVLGAFRPRSAAGMVVDTSAGLTLHGFFALDDSPYHIALRGNLEVTQSTPATPLSSNTYDASNPRRYPVAGTIAGKPTAAWINKDGTITARSPGEAPLPLGSTDLAATQLALIGSADTPGALWTGPRGVYTQLSGGQPSQLSECETRAGVYTSAMAVPILSGAWLSSWTKAGGMGASGFIGSQERGTACGSLLCIADAECDGDSWRPGVRNAAAATASRQGDESGTVFAASASPYLRVGEAGTPEAGLNLIVARIVFGPQPLTTQPITEPIGVVELSKMAPRGALLEGPDWPAVSILPPNRLAVAWIEPRGESGDVLKTKRLQICAP
ncbi:MAG TPA: hypothetical protein VK524_08515 [Polyangiaceae bacterium]|nr:hypothetical protein [Polyangiaceae bacterium]